jgi:S-DNA-T family DNA segregation ATPase FtsK/SpoIIIE
MRQERTSPRVGKALPCSQLFPVYFLVRGGLPPARGGAGGNPGGAVTPEIAPAQPVTELTAGQAVQRMLAAAARLQDTCRADMDDLRKLRDPRQQRMSEAERTARASIDRALAAAPGIGDATSLGSSLRARLAELGGVQTRQAALREVPDLADAISQWQQLAAAAQRAVREVTDAHREWQSRAFKRAKSTPKVPDSLWDALDRLDQIHRAVPVLREALITAAVRQESDRLIAAMTAEGRRREVNQTQLADEVRVAVTAVYASSGLAAAPWSDPRWRAPAPATAVKHFIRLGDFQVPVPSALGVGMIPALVPFPFTTGIAVGADVAGRDQAAGLLRALIVRLFAATPPGTLHVKVIDPVALGQSAAEFRHLAEYDGRLMDEKTWTSERDIERVLDELAGHLEVVISRYLRGQFDSIDSYNRHAGEIAQPYRVLTVFDYPNGFSDRAAGQLLSLIENGPRCGVYTILHYDPTADARESHPDVPIGRLIHSMLKVACHGNSSGAAQLTGTRGPSSSTDRSLLLDPAPAVTFDPGGNPLTGCAALLTMVGERVRETSIRPPAVTLDSLLPVLNRSRAGALPALARGAPPVSTDPQTWWTASSAPNAIALLGRSGAQGVTSMYFSSTDVAGGAIMVGLPRSGKTTSLHSVILTLSMLYPPDELELYLIDAKHGVEFKVYERLPHARMVSVNSDREFSLAVLKSIEKEIQRRAELMKAEGSGRANLTEYRQVTGAKMARVVVIIDEFHELFEEPDRIGGEAFAAFSNIVRMGPFAGVHIVLASQTLSGMPAMDRPTLLLLPQRVAFICNEYDAEIVMGEANKAPRFLSKIGEGLFNPARGEESRNQPFQGLYIPADQRAGLLQALSGKAAVDGWRRIPRVFDGDTVVARPRLGEILPSPRQPRGLEIALGEPFTLDDREGVTLRRTRGANLLLLGDDDDLADPAIRGALHSAIAAACSAGAPVIVVDFIGDDFAEHGLTVMDVAEALGAAYTRSRGADTALRGLCSEVARRVQAEDYRARTYVLILFGLQRALSFTPVDPFGSSDADEPSLTDLLTAILRDGPDFGVHTVISADRLKTVDLRLGADLLPELTLRVLGSGADQADFAAATGQYGDVPAPRTGQLLIADQTRGTAKRVRGYAVLSDKTLPPQTEYGS